MNDSAALAERPIQLHGSAIARFALRLAGWHVQFDGLPTRQGVLIVYPHTSNWDFVIGVLAKWAMGIPIVFWGKDTLFELPLFGRWLRWIGGVAVDRHNPRGAVTAMVERFAQARSVDSFLWLALSPEGTRGYRDSWRSGFYQVATPGRGATGIGFLRLRHPLRRDRCLHPPDWQRGARHDDHRSRPGPAPWLPT